MRVCVYLENESLAKRFGETGIGNAAKFQRLSLRLNGVEVCRSWREPCDIVEINPMSFTTSLYVAKRAKQRGRKVVVHVHTTFENFANSFWFANVAAPIVYRNMLRLYREADALICPSNYVLKWLGRIGIETRAYVVENPLDVDKFKRGKRNTYRKLYNLKGIVPFCVGLVIPRKGVETFVELARCFPELDFVWFGPIGKGIVRSFKVQKLLAKAPENAIFTGYVKNIADAYAAGDIFLFPSHSETFGYVVAEAMAAGKPALLRDLEVYEWIPKNAVLRAKTLEEFRSKLAMLVQDPLLRKKLATRGRRLVEKLTPKKIGKKLISVFNEVLAL